MMSVCTYEGCKLAFLGNKHYLLQVGLWDQQTQRNSPMRLEVASFHLGFLWNLKGRGAAVMKA